MWVLILRTLSREIQRRRAFSTGPRENFPARRSPGSGLFDLLVPLYFTVANMDDSMRVDGDVVLMRHQHDGVALQV